MKTTKILSSIKANKELMKAIEGKRYCSTEDFITSAKRYIQAIKEGRMICSIGSVSQSGMSRTIKLLECNGNKKNGYRYYNFFLLFCLLGFTQAKQSDYFRINGCGMDMIFHTNYTIIRKLHTLGFISKKECDHLAQQTPAVI